MPGEGNFKHKNEAPGVKCVRMEVTAGHAGFVFVLVVLVHGFWTFFYWLQLEQKINRIKMIFHKNKKKWYFIEI